MVKERKPGKITNTTNARHVLTDDGIPHLTRPRGFPSMMPCREPSQVKKARDVKKAQEQSSAHSDKQDPWFAGSDPWSAGSKGRKPQKPPTEAKAVSTQLKSRESAAEEKQRRKQKILESEIILASCSALYFEESPHSENPGENAFQVHI